MDWLTRLSCSDFQAVLPLDGYKAFKADSLRSTRSLILEMTSFTS